ncbi:hypothetical protein OPKNFCMD_6766 [Methylobacterium crusticola]|uniref:HD domain-containing protein n=1 Tax=Methylobacterium crusticola TaxID=1697972 RepID=A0ABQ4R8D6_9HYPH|nr:HD domain-containing protein [Methylobacterium crusticola]GJD53986.1 hypothetical protein OPKNFCMD_6766 [Methylobacterium crusticola]
MATGQTVDDLRSGILEDLPEIAWIGEPGLREGTVAAWSLALRRSSFARVRDIPGDANPGVMVLKRGGQNVHLSGVTRLALASVDHFAAVHPEAVIDRDIVVAGGLCHDVGKAWECDPSNLRRWATDPSRVGSPSLRHPIYGAHICLSVGLPEAVAHIAACHSPEGDNVKRSLECMIVHDADHTWWTICAAAGLVQESTLPDRMTRLFGPRQLRATECPDAVRR